MNPTQGTGFDPKKNVTYLDHPKKDIYAGMPKEFRDQMLLHKFFDWEESTHVDSLAGMPEKKVFRHPYPTNTHRNIHHGSVMRNK